VSCVRGRSKRRNSTMHCSSQAYASPSSSESAGRFLFALARDLSLVAGPRRGGGDLSSDRLLSLGVDLRLGDGGLISSSSEELPSPPARARSSLSSSLSDILVESEKISLLRSAKCWNICRLDACSEWSVKGGIWQPVRVKSSQQSSKKMTAGSVV